MFGLNSFVVVIVINSLSNSDKKDTNFFDKTATVNLAAIKTMSEDTVGNVHAKSDIQKQAYDPALIKTVKQAYGLTGTNFNTHTAYRNGKRLTLGDMVYKNQEIKLIKNSLKLNEAMITSEVHRILPERTGS